jgi:hypothetical protein
MLFVDVRFICEFSVKKVSETHVRRNKFYTVFVRYTWSQKYVEVGNWVVSLLILNFDLCE